MKPKERLEKDILELVGKNKTLSTVDLTYFLIGKYDEFDINSATDNLIRSKKLLTTPSKGQLLIHLGVPNISLKTETEKYIGSKSKK